MYPAVHAVTAPERPALVMASSGRTVTYRQLDERSARLAAHLREKGLRRGDTVVVALGNDLRWAEIVWTCLRSGLFVAPVNWHLTVAELVPLLQDAAPAAIITSATLFPAVAQAAEEAMPPIRPHWLVTDSAQGGTGPGAAVLDFDDAVASTARDPDLTETAGARLLFSSGTTGRPKAFRQPLLDLHPAKVPVRLGPLLDKLHFDEPGLIYLSTGPAYHAAPFAFMQTVHQLGGTVVMMERFDAEAALKAIEKHRVTHSQWVPTMFVRLLRLPEDIRDRYDLSSHRVAVHSGAPCPPEVKRRTLEWWGPIVHEYYGASEGFGHTVIGPGEWLAHPGSVGRAVRGRLHVTDDDGNELPADQVGTVWFEPPGAEPGEKPDWGTVGDLGRLDADGYLYLTGRAGQTIITGGVNVYPREIEDLLIGHPAVADVAALGVPDEEFGEQVKAVVQVVPGATADDDLAATLIAYCRERLAHFKCPRSVDFLERVPRTPTGKLLAEPLRRMYWPPARSSSREIR